MAGSIEANAVIYKKYKYTAPTPPSNLIDSSNFMLNFAERRFLNIGFDPSNNFNVTIHIITPSRYISISPEFLKRVFSLMGNILSFILDPPTKFKKINFLETESILLTNMVYRGENVVVFDSKIVEGCRVLLPRKDLLTLQDLEWAIFETTTRKSMVVLPMLLEQYYKIINVLKNKITRKGLTQHEEIKLFIVSLYDEEIMDDIPRCSQSFISQLKLFACDQLAIQYKQDNLVQQRNIPVSFYKFNFLKQIFK